MIPFSVCVFYSKSTKVIMSLLLDTLAAELDFFDGSLFTWIEKLVNLFSKTFVIFLSSSMFCENMSLYGGCEMVCVWSSLLRAGQVRRCS